MPTKPCSYSNLPPTGLPHHTKTMVMMVGRWWYYDDDDDARACYAFAVCALISLYTIAWFCEKCGAAGACFFCPPHVAKYGVHLPVPKELDVCCVCGVEQF